MSVPSDRLQEIIQNKDAKRALEWVKEHGYSEGWAIINDEALVIYDVDDPPQWLEGVLDNLDEDGNLPEKFGILYSRDVVE